MAYDFKKAEDVKEYLKNLHIEYQFGCYSEKKAEVCHLLGDFKESIKREFDKAAELYKMSCDKYDYGRSCAKFGDYSLLGKGCPKDVHTAFKYMSKGCELNDVYGCYHGGAVAIGDELGDDGREARTKKGVEYLHKACDEHKLEKACFHLAGVYLKGIEGYIEPNYIEGYKLSLRCCEQGNPMACANVSQMYARGEGVEQNKELADVFKKRALDLKRVMESGGMSLKFHEGT